MHACRSTLEDPTVPARFRERVRGKDLSPALSMAVLGVFALELAVSGLYRRRTA